jgi:hypothetical protein
MVLGISPLVFVLFFATHDDSIPFGLVIIVIPFATVTFTDRPVTIDECVNHTREADERPCDD